MSVSRRKAIALGAGTAMAAATGTVTGATAGAAPAAAGGPGAPGRPASLDPAPPPGFRSHFATVNGVRLHYLAGGQGTPLILLAGWPETWYAYRKVMPTLARRYQVIVAELRGMGASGKPPSGYDKKTMAADILALTSNLGFTQVNIAGHDIGSMVAFSFAVNHPSATQKVALLEVTHPDPTYNELRLLPQPGLPIYPWWFAFNQVHGLPEKLLPGRSRFLIDSILDDLLVNKAAVNDHARTAYAQAYSHPAAIRASNGWYQTIPQDIADFASYGKVTAPMLGLASPIMYQFLKQVLPAEGTDVRVQEIQDTGHYLLEEQPKAVAAALTTFFG